MKESSIEWREYSNESKVKEDTLHQEIESYDGCHHKIQFIIKQRFVFTVV